MPGISLVCASVGALALAVAATGADRSNLSLMAPDSPSADQVRALVADMLADAETRSSLLQSGATAGHDGRFFLASPDGSFRLTISGQLLSRYTVNTRNDENNTVDDFQTGFTNPRMVLRFDGKVFDRFIYGVQGKFNRSGGGLTLEDAFVGYDFDNGWSAIWGQIREPILWEDVLHDKYSLAADQSVVNAVFAQGYSQGAWAFYSADNWRMWAGVDDGIRSANTDLGADPADYGFTTRWEYKIGGDWSQFDVFSSPMGSAFAVKLGGGAHYERSPRVKGPLPPAGGGTLDTKLLAYTGDVMIEGDGWNVFVTGVGLYSHTNGGVGTFNDYGFVVQGGFLVTDKLEPFARYDVVIPDGGRTGDHAFNTITAGANYYIHGQAAKFTIDFQWFMDSVAGNDLVAAAASGAPGSVGNRIGLFPSNNNNQYAVRVQFQLLF